MEQEALSKMEEFLVGRLGLNFVAQHASSKTEDVNDVFILVYKN